MIDGPNNYGNRDTIREEAPTVKLPNPRALIPLVLIAVFGGGGYYIDKQRAKERAALTGRSKTLSGMAMQLRPNNYGMPNKGKAS